MAKRRREKKILTEVEIEKLKAVCETFSNQLIVYGLLYSGMRIDELCHLEASWLNRDCTIITIPESAPEWIPGRISRGETIWSPKKITWHFKHSSGIHISDRTIPVLNPTLTAILKRVVEYDYKLHMTPKEVWVRVNQLWARTGCEGRISPHFFRHTCFTLMIDAGFEITHVAAQAGHRSTNITLKTYIHPDSAHLIRRVREKGGI